VNRLICAGLVGLVSGYRNIALLTAVDTAARFAEPVPLVSSRSMGAAAETAEVIVVDHSPPSRPRGFRAEQADAVPQSQGVHHQFNE
jgi:hypothetical protein